MVGADLTLEDLVLAYLAEPSSGSLPGPDRLGIENGMEMTS